MPLRKRVTEIPADELEELQVAEAGAVVRKETGAPRGPVVVARSDRATVQFGLGLAPEELEYICALVKRVVTA